MQTIAEMLKEKGREEGREEGRREVFRNFLVKALPIRFGQVPESVERRIETADAESLERWCLRILPARSLDEVFEP